MRRRRLTSLPCIQARNLNGNPRSEDALVQPLLTPSPATAPLKTSHAVAASCSCRRGTVPSAPNSLLLPYAVEIRLQQRGDGRQRAARASRPTFQDVGSCGHARHKPSQGHLAWRAAAAPRLPRHVPPRRNAGHGHGFSQDVLRLFKRSRQSSSFFFYNSKQSAVCHSPAAGFPGRRRHGSARPRVCVLLAPQHNHVSLLLYGQPQHGRVFHCSAVSRSPRPFTLDAHFYSPSYSCVLLLQVGAAKAGGATRCKRSQALRRQNQH